MTVTHVHLESSAPWADDLRELLGRTPIPVSELADLLCEYEVTVEELEDELRASCDVRETADGWVSLFAAADGVVLTHVLDAGEREYGVLVADGDLDLWARLADQGIPLVDGGEVRTRWAASPEPLPVGAESGLVGPDGWLDRYQPGQLLALRLRDDRLSIEPLDDIELDGQGTDRCEQVCRHCAHVAAEAVSAYMQDEGDLCWALLDGAIASLVVADADVLTEPLPPLGTLLDNAGLQVSGGFVGMPGAPAIEDADEFDAAEVGGLVVARVLLNQMAGEELLDVEHLRRLLTVLDIPVVAERVAVAVEASPLSDQAIQSLLEAAASDDQRGLGLLLAARSAEGRGDYVTAERHVDEAARLVPSCWIVVVDAAQYAAARGDVVRADALFRTSGCPDDHPLRLTLKRLQKPPEGVVSRNRPCPCGSGRKYKACCLRHVLHPLPARAPLAYARLLSHAQRADLFDEIADLVSAVEPCALPLALDLAIFDHGVADDYLDRRGHLLADDEHELVESWLHTPLAPYEVADVQAGRSVTLRSLLGGESVVVPDRGLSACVTPLDVLVARPLWDGTRHVLLSHPTHVHRMRRVGLIDLFDDADYDPQELVAFFAPQPPPVVVHNRDGEDLVFCDAVYDVDDDAAWDRLGEYLLVDDEGDRLVLGGREVADEEILLRGSVSRDGRTWIVDTNSRERFDELRKLLLEVAPSATLVSESSRPAAELMGDHPGDATGDATTGSPFGVSDDVDIPAEEQRRILDEYMGDYEQRWVDDQIPALGGMSPRAAVAIGGAALVVLEALLDDIEWMHRSSGGGMDANRIRRHLGLKATSRG
jgi:hypothetical protein